MNGADEPEAVVVDVVDRPVPAPVALAVVPVAVGEVETSLKTALVAFLRIFFV
jgi:hypothetical protein